MRLHPSILRATAVVAFFTMVAAPAWGKKNIIKGSVDGVGHKWRGRYVIASYGGNGTIIVASKPARPGGIVRTIGFGCPIYPPNETFPLTPPAQYCNANYTEARVGRNPQTKAWLAPQNVQVTFQSFTGSRIAGTVSGELTPLLGTGATEPITIDAMFDTAIRAK